MLIDTLKVILRIIAGAIFIAAGILTAIYMWPISEYFAVLIGLVGISIGLIVWFPASVNFIAKELFDSI